MREHTLSVDDLIWPLFVCEGQGVRDPIPSMPGVFRYSVDQLVVMAQQAKDLGIPVIALFPYTPQGLRDPDGTEALNANNLVCQACRAIKGAVPDLGLLTDVALDPYTSHGHDGLLEDGQILNDQTVDVLVEQALVQARAGADIIAPSDMMDGRVAAIRAGLMPWFQMCRSWPMRQILLRPLWPFRDALVQCHIGWRQANLSDGPVQHQ